MILVIADDLTGAAEIAGIGWRFGLDVRICTEVTKATPAELLVISADTRSLTEFEAIEKVQKITEICRLMNPALIYKKIDSVLRGHVLPEIKIIKKILQLQNCLIIPTNPSMGRRIQDGKYYIGDKLAHETSFAQDPEFPIKDSQVLNMLRATPNDGVEILKKPSTSTSAMVIAEVEHKEDLSQWATYSTQKGLLVGGAEFFASILENLGYNLLKTSFFKQNITQKCLYVSGTTFRTSIEKIQNRANQVGGVYYLPSKLVDLPFDSELFNQTISNWASNIVEGFNQHQVVIIAIERELEISGILPTKLAKLMAMVVKKVLNQIHLEEILIEGGATSAAILAEIPLQSFLPTEEFAQGVIRMQCLERPSTYITLKPGSYTWPQSVVYAQL